MAAKPATTLALDGEGLRVIVVASGTSRLLPFGAPEAAALNAIEDALAAPPADRGFSEDCQVGYATWTAGLTAWFTDSAFVGWSLRGDSSGLATLTGIGIGSTRTELDRTYDAEIFESTLGTEFIINGLVGLLASSAQDAVIDHLWAGRTCIAR